MPKYEVNMNEYNLTFNLVSFAIDDKDKPICHINVPFVLINTTGPFAYKDFDDVLILGTQFFYNYQGIQWNFDTKKVAFTPYPPRGTSEDNDIKKTDKSFPTWAIIVLVIVGVAVLGGIGFWVYQKKKVQKDLASAEYGRL